MPTQRPRLQMPRVDPQRTVAFLQKCESSLRNKAIALIAFGVPLSLIGPLIFTGFVLLFTSKNGRLTMHYWQAFPWVCLVSLPLLFALAWMIKGSILEKSGDTLDGLPRFGVRGRAAVPLVILEMANIGPRMVIHGTRQLRGQASSKIDLNRGADAIGALMLSEDGVSPARLLRDGEPAQNLEPILAFLMFYDLADISKTGDRVWLRTEARKRLAAATN